MAVDVPDLDDRTYEDLLADLRKHIPVVAEEWTDHNAHDPGITIVELLAWLAESYRYELNRIEDRHRLKYLELLDHRPEPPVPATARVQVMPSRAVEGVEVPERTRLLATDGDATRAFETTAAVTLAGARVARVVGEDPGGRTDHTASNAGIETYFRAFGDRATSDSRLYVGFDGDPFADPTAPLDLAVAFHEGDLPPPASHGDEAVDFTPSVALRWEFCTDYAEWERDGAWEPLAVRRDTTDRLYGSGLVTLEHPGPARWGGADDTDPGMLGHPGLAWVRVRVVTPGYEVPPQFDSLRINVLPVEHRAAGTDVRLANADGDLTTALPNQRFAFDGGDGGDAVPVLDAAVTVGGNRWERVPDRDASGPADRHFVLDETAGEVRFGDNVRGRVPDPEQAVVAMAYEIGGGDAGNVSASATWAFDESVEDDGASTPDREATVLRNATVTPLGSATGGRDAEGVDDALARLRRDLAEPFRLVSAADYEHVATSTPGLRFGRAQAVVVPESSELGVAGGDAAGGECDDHDRVRVVVVPYSPFDRPTPSEGFLHAVRCHLERHRLLTDRVEAVAPTYVGIGVAVEVRLHGGYAATDRTAAVERELNRFLSPLSGFGGGGWPFGQPVYRSELYEAVDGVEGVDCALDIDVTVTGEATRDGPDVVIPPEALVYPTDHAVTVSEDGRTCGEARR